jgi:hypothetical protein
MSTKPSDDEQDDLGQLVERVNLILARLREPERLVNLLANALRCNDARFHNPERTTIHDVRYCCNVLAGLIGEYEDADDDDDADELGRPLS